MDRIEASIELFRCIKKYKYFGLISIFIMNVMIGYAIPITNIHSNLSENFGYTECSVCHSTQTEHYQTGLIQKDPSGIQNSVKIESINYGSFTQSNSLESFVTTKVAGNITLITSVGQNWYQQGIYGPNQSDSSVDKSWGWTFFDETPSSGYITPPEKVTQRNKIYALLLDSGNNSIPITDALVTANVTYWIYDGINYTNSTIPVQLLEDLNHSGLYSGNFYFYGGTPTGSCQGCHPMHGGDINIGYFPGNYTATIIAQADNKIKTAQTSFEVTPWGCEDCHGSGNPHKTKTLGLDSFCYLCHGINQIMHRQDDAGNPHQNTAHRTIQCTDCHTSKSLNPQTFNGVNFIAGENNKSIPQYNYLSTQLNSGTHASLTCTNCHNDLALPTPQGNFKPDNYTIRNTINKYDPDFTSIQQFQDYYVINVNSGEPFNVTLDWEGISNIGFYLYPPNFNPVNRTSPFSPDKGDYPYYNGSTFTNKPENYTNSTPLPGKWILEVYGFDLATYWVGMIQPPLNYTINSTYPIQQKNLPTIPECNSCHNSNGSGKAFTNDQIPDWNPGFAHVDINNDGNLDVQCRMCHNAMHDITVKACLNCHTTAPTDHPISEPAFSQYTQAQCLTCHGDPHKVTMAGGGCIGCHSNPGTRYYVNTSLFVGHANVNTSDGANNVTDADCMTCHFRSSDIIMSPDAGLGAANHSNTLFCDDCHTTAGVGPIHPTDPNLLKNSLQHGSTNCQWCHIAGDPLPRPLDSTLRFHPNGPGGTASGKNCLSCHYFANLPDSPFHAPGEKHRNDISKCDDCHSQADNHGVTPMISDPPTPPLISDLSVTTPVIAGDVVHVQNRVTDQWMQIAAAQYQLKKGTTIVKDWTNMTPIEGRFDSLSEVVIADIDTSSLLGTYTVYVKGMASAPKTGGGPYYPFNGQWSGVYTTQFIVNEPEGFDNGTVYGSSGDKLAGAIVSTDTGISTTTNETGFYSLSLANGTYHLTASKEPEYYTNNSVVVTVTAFTTITQDIILTPKPTGNISGTVRVK